MSAKEVLIYSLPTWPPCKFAKSFLDENKVPYVDINVAENNAALEEMITRSGQMSVPVIIIDGELMIGFNKGQLKEKLGL